MNYPTHAAMARVRKGTRRLVDSVGTGAYWEDEYWIITLIGGNETETQQYANEFNAGHQPNERAWVSPWAERWAP